LIWGDFTNDLLRVNGTFSIRDAYTFPDVDGTSGQVLTTNGIGDLAWSNINVNDADSNPNNEIQDISLNGTNLSISNGSTVNLAVLQDGVNDADNNPNNEIQDISLNGTNLSISSGSTINLNVLQDGFTDADANPSNELQNLSISGNTLSISNGNSVNLPSFTGALELEDQDMDTRITVEQNPDEDRIRMTVAGTERARLGQRALELIGTGNSVYIGLESNLNGGPDGTDNVGVGRNTLQQNNGNFNVALGVTSMQSNTVGDGNVAVGPSSLQANTIGNSNVAVGFGAQAFNITGNQNLALGQQALFTNVGGSGNIAIGFNSLGSNAVSNSNISIGYNAMANSLGGARNVALGDSSLQFATVSNLVAIGDNAMRGNTTGLYNTAVGSQALLTNSTADYNTALGSAALAFATNERNTGIGSFALAQTTSGTRNTALGDEALNLTTQGSNNTALGSRAGYLNVTGTFNTFVGRGTDGQVNNTFNATALGADAIVTASNQVRIGDALVNDIGGFANWSNISDGRFKNNVTEQVAGLDFILQLRPVTYQLDERALLTHLGKASAEKLQQSSRQEEIQTGFIAQEVEAAAEAVNYDFSGVKTPTSEDDTYALRYAEFVVPLVKAVQEQQTELDSQQAQIDELKAQNAELKALIEALIEKEDH
ncbi:MAG: tail fiber domain-containing protein, partial [Bacteroidota bacterium]